MRMLSEALFRYHPPLGLSEGGGEGGEGGGQGAGGSGGEGGGEGGEGGGGVLGQIAAAQIGAVLGSDPMGSVLTQAKVKFSSFALSSILGSVLGPIGIAVGGKIGGMLGSVSGSTAGPGDSSGGSGAGLAIADDLSFFASRARTDGGGNDSDHPKPIIRTFDARGLPAQFNDKIVQNLIFKALDDASKYGFDSRGTITGWWKPQNNDSFSGGKFSSDTSQLPRQYAGIGGGIRMLQDDIQRIADRLTELGLPVINRPVPIENPIGSPITGTVINGPTTSPIVGTMINGPTTSPITGTAINGPTTSPITGTVINGPTTSPITGTVINGPTTSPTQPTGNQSAPWLLGLGALLLLL